MPNTVRNKKVNTTTNKEDINKEENLIDNIVDNNKDDKEEELVQAQKEITELKAKFEEMMSLLSTMSQDKVKENNSKEELKYNNEDTEEVYDEPNPNKNIKVISLYYGSLNLSDGYTTALSFDKYGQVKNCLYNKLVDIVNKNAKFAENGYFYIADKSAVYHLGLSDVYKNIKPKEVLDNICKYDDSSIESICKSITDVQKEEMAFGLAKRKFNGESLDYNKLELISKLINKDILGMVKEMQSTSDILSGSNN